jgi:hypothetical protein
MRSLGNWLESFEQPLKMATDSLSWDWPWFQEIFYEPGTWPENVDGKPVSLYELIDSPFFEGAVAQAFEQDPSLRRHHSLDDAKANRQAFLAFHAKCLDLPGPANPPLPVTPGSEP